jgi:photosynthetic reaction center cytochrome c subunit
MRQVGHRALLDFFRDLGRTENEATKSMRNRVTALAARAILVVVAMVISAMVIGGFKAKARQSQTGAPQGGEKKAEEQFKNIQVLKGIPAEQLIPTMQFITASLGVECDFCHVQGAFEKDDKKTKQTARKMMEMMIAINADNFDRQREVTCYTCHRGNANPVGMPPVMVEEAKNMGMPHGADDPSKEKEEATKSSGPAADQLLDKYLQASGGAAAIDKITSRVMKGTIEVGGKSMPIDIYAKDPEMRISYTHLPEGDSVTAFNGHEGWLGMSGRPLREMHGPDLDGAAIDADLHFPAHLKQMFSKVELRVGTEKIGDHETYAVVGQREGKTPIEMYFDEQTGLLVRLVRFGETALGRLPTQIDYADYRESGGVKIPFRWTLARPGGRFTIQLSEAKENVPVDDAKFVKPPAPPEPQKRPAN